MADTNGSEDTFLIVKKSIFGIPAGSEFKVQWLSRVLYNLQPVDENVNGGKPFPIESAALLDLLRSGILKVKE